MADLPILFSGAMVRAILREIEQLGAGKTQTRRFIDFPGIDRVREFCPVGHDKRGRRIFEMKDAYGKHVSRPAGKHISEHQFWPKYAVGDQLYVREAWAPLEALTHSDPGTQALADRGFYRADEGTVEAEISRWKPSIHMPRWASRITLIVSDVRMQQLWDISEQDAVAEGVERDSDGWLDYLMPATQSCASAQRSFQTLWDSINGDRPGAAWPDNPWVAAYTFQPVLANINSVHS